MIASILLVAAMQQPSLGVTGLRVEYLTNPLGIAAPTPRLSWRITSAERNIVQAAYQIRVSRNEHVIWDSGRIGADSSVFVTYAGPALAPRTRYAWRVRVWDGKGRASAWSENASWETGLLQPSDWSAAWIGTAIYGSACLFGTYTSFKNIISYPTQSNMSLQIQGTV